MFSNEDIRDIFQLIPPEKGSGGSPPLVLSANGDGLLTLQYVQAEFEKFVSTKRDRVSASALADELDVDTDLVLQLVRETSTLTLLSQNKRNIITKEERYSIEKQLQDLLRTQLVSKSTFSRDQDISMDSIDALTHTDDDSTRLKDDFLEFDDYIISKSYQHVVRDAVSSDLERSFKDAESVELSTEKVPGSPPVWYILQTVKNLLRGTGKTSQFHIQEKTDSVRCVPTEFLERKRDVQITQLKDGALACVDLNSFWNDFRELYPSLKDVQTYLESEAEVELVGSVAVSNIWASKVGSQCLQELEQHGYVEFASKIESQLPPSIRNQTQEKVENQITTTYQQASHNSLHKASPYLLTPSKYESSRTALLGTAKTYASTQWTQLKDTPLKDPKFLTSTFLDTIPAPEAPLLQTLTKDRIIEKAIEDHFWASISALETQNETAFATFWLDTLILRFRTYEIGLNAIQDLKLQDQLADLLATYMQKEQLPDILSKVRSQGLLQSRKTRKNIQKLESALYIPSTLTAVPTTATTTSTATENDKEPGKLTLQTLTTTLSKFSKKQNIPEPSPADLSSYKTTLLSEVTRRFQKQAPSKKQKSSDGPVLFLTLVIILLARYFPGVVYATGKSAPRLLKVLREKVDEDVFERLEGWKEKAKLGTLSGEDREGMRGMALALGVEGGGGLGLEQGVEGEGGDDEG